MEEHPRFACRGVHVEGDKQQQGIMALLVTHPSRQGTRNPAPSAIRPERFVFLPPPIVVLQSLPLP
jgi:hypothetical protein